MRDLSILIPARNEIFLRETIQNILENIEKDTEIIAVLDGVLANPPIPQHERVTVVYLPESVGQRAATNIACRLAMGKYVMKCDAHVAFDKGFDRKLIDDMKDDWTVVPVMKNLHAFDWICPDGHRRYQGPSGACAECGKETTRDIIFKPREKTPNSTAFRFDSTMHFQYWPELKARQEGDLVETMSLQGSCFMLTREKYWELDICSEEFNSWGQQGVEVACKTWLSGGRVMVNRKTWYAHMFRTQGGDFSFPYHNPESKIRENREYSRKLFAENNWPKAKHPFQWLINKFSPPEWVTKEIIYYTCNTHDPRIDEKCRKYLKAAGIPIVSVSLNKELDFGDTRIVMHGERSPEMMHKQVLEGLRASTADVVYLCESDVLYHKSHFYFDPPKNDTFYYDTNVWKYWVDTKKYVWTDDLQQVSGVCADRKLLLDFYEKRNEQIEREGFNKHFEPGIKQTVGGQKVENYQSEKPNVCIRHDQNITYSKRSPDKFNNPEYAKGWREADEIPYWRKVRL